MEAELQENWLNMCPMGLFDGVWLNSRQLVMSHLVSRVPSVFALLVFPRASFVSCLACSEKGWRDRNRFRPGELAVTVSCSLCWSSASAWRDKARHCLVLRMSGGIVPLTTGSMKVGVDRMHPDTSRRLLFSELHRVDVCGEFQGYGEQQRRSSKDCGQSLNQMDKFRYRGDILSEG